MDSKEFSVRPHAQRQLRRLLLDRRFQLKYTGMVVVVTVVVASVLGYVAYDYSRGQTQALTIQIAMQPDLDPAVAADLESYAKQHDHRALFGIIGGILALAVALGVTGIVITHRVVGPVYKMKRLFLEVSVGPLRVEERLRRGDELQDLFDAFASMVHSLFERHERMQHAVFALIAIAEKQGSSREVIEGLQALHADLKAMTDQKAFS